MKRLILYIAILISIVFIPFSCKLDKKEKKNVLTTNSVSVKIVQAPQKVQTKKVLPPKPKKKKQVPKPKPKPKSKKVIKPVKKIIEPNKIEVPKEEIVQEIVEKVEVQKEPVVTKSVLTPVKTSQPQIQQSEVDAYYATVYELIDEKKYYPKKARRFKQEDSIPIKFTINKEGVASGFEIVTPSKYKELNKAVKKMFKKIKKFNKPPNAMQTPLEISIEIKFNL